MVVQVVNDVKEILKNTGRLRLLFLVRWPRGEARPDSDVDILVEFDRKKLSLLTWCQFRVSWREK